VLVKRSYRGQPCAVLHTTKSKSACAVLISRRYVDRCPSALNDMARRTCTNRCMRHAPCPSFIYRRGASMETFFVRKQIIIGAAFLAPVELTLRLVNVLKQAH